MAIPSDICFLAGTLGQGGCERQLFYILKVLQRSGARLHVLSLTRSELWEGRIRELGIPVTWIGQSKSRLVRLGSIISVLRRRPPDILQSQHFYTNLYAAAAARVLGVREVGAIRLDAANEVRSHNRLTSAIGFRIPRLLAANSRAAIRNATARGVKAERLCFLPNVIDTGVFKFTARNGSGPTKLITVGRMVEQKRQERFLSLLARLRNPGLDVRGIMVGDGPLRRPLERRAAELGLLPGAVEFRGEVQDVSPAYQEADILVQTSDYEGTPNVVLEAMASGLPVVATNVGGTPEIIHHGETGYLVDPEDEDSIVDSVTMLIGSPQLRKALGHRGRQYVEANHSLERLPAFLDVVYTRALA